MPAGRGGLKSTWVLFAEHIISLLDPSPLYGTPFLIQILLYISFTLSPIIKELTTSRSPSLLPFSKSTPSNTSGIAFDHEPSVCAEASFSLLVYACWHRIVGSVLLRVYPDLDLQLMSSLLTVVASQHRQWHLSTAELCVL